MYGLCINPSWLILCSLKNSADELLRVPFIKVVLAVKKSHSLTERRPGYLLGGYNTDPTKTHVVMMAPLNIPKYAPWNNSKRSNEYAILKNDKGSGAEMCSGIVTEDAPFSYWPIFFPVPFSNPRSLCESQHGPVSFCFLKWGIT